MIANKKAPSSRVAAQMGQEVPDNSASSQRNKILEGGDNE